MFRFSALETEFWLRASFLGRCEGVDVLTERETALSRLEPIHAALRAELGFASTFVAAQQVHGDRVAVVDGSESDPIPDVDGLLTNRPNVCLGIYVADCAAVYLVDPRQQAIGLVHAGKKGAELGIVPHAIREMTRAFGTEPSSLILQIGPSIRPPHYEVDFTAAIADQAREAGVNEIHDCGICTATHADRFYSYRLEKGRTGRMLALLEIVPDRR